MFALEGQFRLGRMKSKQKQSKGKEKVPQNETNEERIALTSPDSIPNISHNQSPELCGQASQQDRPCLQSQPTSCVSNQRLSDGTLVRSTNVNAGPKAIEIDEKGNFRPDNKAVKEIVKIFKSMFRGASGTWCTTSESLRKAWFDDFRKKCSWPEEQEELVWKAFNKHGAKRFSDTLNQVKKRKKKPGWMSGTDYDNLKIHWNSERHQRYSAANKKNRLGKDGSGPNLHTAGATPFYVVEQKMEENLGRRPTIRELVTRTHTHADTHKKAGKAVDKTSEKIMRDLSERVVASRTAAATEENVFPTDGTLNVPAPPTVDEMGIYLEVTGGRRKGGSVYGLGSLSGEPSAGYSSYVSQKRKHDEEVAERMKQMENENEGLRADVQMMKKKMRKMEKLMKLQWSKMQVDEEESEDTDASDSDDENE